jgi:hypothetical protein
MSESSSKSGTEGGIVLRLGLVGLIVFSATLVLAGGLISAVLLSGFSTHVGSSPKSVSSSNSQAGRGGAESSAETPAWGDLLTSEIELERPEEYVAFEVGTNQAPSWFFEKMSPDQARGLMLSCGLSAAQTDQALTPVRCAVSAAGTLVRPEEQLIFSLTPGIREKLYRELAKSAGNHYMQYPFFFPEQHASDWLKNAKLAPELVARIDKLIYPRGTVWCFSDFEVIMRGISSEEDRITLVKALSRQPAVLARLRIKPDTDIDRLLGYWGRGIQVKDARPLLESLKRLGTERDLSLLYLLPRFARERLYTFPMPPRPNDPPIDCHWSTMNFFNEVPDDRFTNPVYTVQYLTTNFYRVAKPSLYGDIVLVLNEQGNAIHSAVYLADDIVFTKNGNNFSQPWMLMRLKDVVGDYAGDAPPRMLFYRGKGL